MILRPSLATWPASAAAASGVDAGVLDADPDPAALRVSWSTFAATAARSASGERSNDLDWQAAQTSAAVVASATEQTMARREEGMRYRTRDALARVALFRRPLSTLADTAASRGYEPTRDLAR